MEQVEGIDRRFLREKPVLDDAITWRAGKAYSVILQEQGEYIVAEASLVRRANDGWRRTAPALPIRGESLSAVLNCLHSLLRCGMRRK